MANQGWVEWSAAEERAMCEMVENLEFELSVNEELERVESENYYRSQLEVVQLQVANGVPVQVSALEWIQPDDFIQLYWYAIPFIFLELPAHLQNDAEVQSYLYCEGHEVDHAQPLMYLPRRECAVCRWSGVSGPPSIIHTFNPYAPFIVSS